MSGRGTLVSMSSELPVKQTLERPHPLVFGRFDYAAFLAYFAYAAGSVVAPVSLVELARDLGFRLEKGGMTAGGALHLGRTAAIVTTMLLCGFWAARWGKRRLLAVSVLTMGLGVGMVSVAPTYAILFLAIIAAGTGEGFSKGWRLPSCRSCTPTTPAAT
jgi:MFS family permease